MAVLLSCFAGSACQGTAPRQHAAPDLSETPGSYRFPISTLQPLAAHYFNRGMILMYGSDHAAAERSFMRALRLDPGCALCWWGAAVVLGPHLGAEMGPGDEVTAWKRLQEARRLAPRASPREQAFVRALSARYASDARSNRASLNLAYADAMRALVQRFPDDVDAMVLLAEALMNLRPGEWYGSDGQPQPGTREIEKLLEIVLQRAPDHPGANHLYVLLVATSPIAERGLAAAQRLERMEWPTAQLLHVPSHIYMRTGRYGAAVRANLRAVAAAAGTEMGSRSAGVEANLRHHHHALWWAASMAGNSRTALAAARQTAAQVSEDLIAGEISHRLELALAAPWLAQVRFGRWEEVLEEEAPPRSTLHARALWHYARGMALLRRDRVDEARREWIAVAGYAEQHLSPGHPAVMEPAAAVLEIAQRMLAGELALQSGQHNLAIALLAEARHMEDQLPLTEPPLWSYPVRHALGAAYLAAGEPRQAELAYREDLARNRDNGWSLYGLALALRAQHRARDAFPVERQLRLAWAHADVALTGSRF